MRVKKGRVRTVTRQGSFFERVVNAWNGLPRKVVAAEMVERFKLELDRYVQAFEIDGYRDSDRNVQA